MTDVTPTDGGEPTAAPDPAAALEPTPDATPAPAPAPPTAPPAPAAAAGAWGPPGEIRNWGMVAVLTIITCGIYGIFWQYYVFRDNKEFSGEGVGGGIAVIFAIFIGIVNLFLLPAEIGNIYAKAGLEKPVKGTTGFWNLIPLVGWFIWLAKVQNAINDQWVRAGVTPA